MSRQHGQDHDVIQGISGQGRTDREPGSGKLAVGRQPRDYRRKQCWQELLSKLKGSRAGPCCTAPGCTGCDERQADTAPNNGGIRPEEEAESSLGKAGAEGAQGSGLQGWDKREGRLPPEGERTLSIRTSAGGEENLPKRDEVGREIEERGREGGGRKERE